jgi:hypothetical protein
MPRKGPTCIASPFGFGISPGQHDSRRVHETSEHLDHMNSRDLLLTTPDMR